MSQNGIVGTISKSTFASGVISNTDSVLGELNEKTTNAVYSGKSTDSLDIIVNNDDYTISGNVKWDDFIGESYSKAYPGDLGARNYKLICDLTTTVNDELAAAAKLKQQLVNRITVLENATDADALSTQISNEVIRATNAEKKLSTSLSGVDTKVNNLEANLSSQLQDVDTELNDRITSLETKIAESAADDVAELKEKQHQLEIDLGSEIVRSTSRDNLLSDSLSSIAASIVEAEQRILATLDSETAARTSTDTELQGLIDALHGATKNDILIVENHIADEVRRAKEAEFKLKLSVEDVRKHVAQLEDMPQLESGPSVNVDEIHEQLAVHEQRLKSLSSQLSKLASSQESLNVEFDNLLTTVTSQLYRTTTDVANNKATILKNVESINELKRLTNSTIKALAQEVDERSESAIKIQNTLLAEIRRSKVEDEKHSNKLNEIVLQIVKHEVRTAEALGRIAEECRQYDAQIMAVVTNLATTQNTFEIETRKEINDIKDSIHSFQEKVIEEITSSLAFDFIDGGTAPI